MRGSWLHRVFGDRLLEKELWQPERERFCAGLAIGVFFSLMPMPFQMAAAGFVAWLARFNMPATLVACWFSNPITMPFLMALEYKVGLIILGKESSKVIEDPSLSTLLKEAPMALITGSVVCAILFGLIAYPVSVFTWNLIEKSLKRHAEKRQRKNLEPNRTVKP